MSIASHPQVIPYTTQACLIAGCSEDLHADAIFTPEEAIDAYSSPELSVYVIRT